VHLEQCVPNRATRSVWRLVARTYVWTEGGKGGETDMDVEVE
jgi:hypothetical protein